MRVLVAICTYNGEKYIKEQLDSIFQNTYQPNQIAVCDDASTDHTIQIVRSLLDEWGGYYTIVSNPQNIGVDKNFEQCFRLCEGELIIPCDQDNVWDKDYIKSFVEVFENMMRLSLPFAMDLLRILN